MASHSWSGNPTKECMIGLQTEKAVATVTEDSTEEKAVARARVDLVTDLVKPIPKLGYWIAGGSIGHLKTRKATRKRLVMIPTKACIINSLASQSLTTVTSQSGSRSASDNQSGAFVSLPTLPAVQLVQSGHQV